MSPQELARHHDLMAMMWRRLSRLKALNEAFEIAEGVANDAQRLGIAFQKSLHHLDDHSIVRLRKALMTEIDHARIPLEDSIDAFVSGGEQQLSFIEPKPHPAPIAEAASAKFTHPRDVLADRHVANLSGAIGHNVTVSGGTP